MADGHRGAASVDLIWLPLGAGAGVGSRWVRGSGRAYESLLARHQHRARLPLYHSALAVRVDSDSFAIEMGPAWGNKEPARGVVNHGSVGLAWLGRSRLFRYEIRCCRDGVIPDLSYAVDSPQQVSQDAVKARTVLKLAPLCPTPTWGLDELGTGEMWNSNSLTSWLLARSGHDTTPLQPPGRGRAPGWTAGLTLAAREPR